MFFPCPGVLRTFMDWTRLVQYGLKSLRPSLATHTLYPPDTSRISITFETLDVPTRSTCRHVHQRCTDFDCDGAGTGEGEECMMIRCRSREGDRWVTRAMTICSPMSRAESDAKAPSEPATSTPRDDPPPSHGKLNVLVFGDTAWADAHFQRDPGLAQDVHFAGRRPPGPPSGSRLSSLRK